MIKMSYSLAGGRNEKKNRKSITLAMKIRIIKLCDDGVTQAEVGRRLGFNRSTIFTVMKSRDRIIAEVKSATPVNATTIRKRGNLVAGMERLLMTWINRQEMPLNQAIIKQKALSLFNDLKAAKGATGKDVEFGASRGWFDRFKKRSLLHNIKLEGETVTADTVAESYLSHLATIINECGYSRDQIFNVQETGLFWKKMSARTFIADEEEETLACYKTSKDRLSLLLGANASGSLKLKPMLIYHEQNPVALKNYVKTRLPVHWRSHAKAHVTATLFEEWFDTCFVPEVQAHFKEGNIPFKVLLLVDNGPSHPQTLDELNPNIRVEFLPSNTASLLQPMDQCVLAAFKLHYLQHTFSKCVAAVDSKAGSQQEIIRKFWKGFNILDCIKTVRDAWNDVKITTLKGAWKNLSPQLVEDFGDLQDSIAEVTDNIVEMARQLDMEVQPEDVAQLLASHTEPISSDDPEEEEDVLEEVCSITHPQGLTSKVLLEAFSHLEAAMALFEKHDRDFERSSRVNASLVRDYACYTDIYKEKKRAAIQTTFHTYFHKGPVASTQNATLRSTPTESPSLGTASTQSPTSFFIAASRSPSDAPARERLVIDDPTCKIEDMAFYE